MYPIHLNLANKNVVIAGGGKVAMRKISGLLESGAEITVISPEAVLEIQNLHAKKLLKWIPKKAEKTDFTGAFFIIAATDQTKVNSEIASYASHTQLVNIADQPEAGNAIIPSKVSRGKLVISVSTSGASPSLSKKIKTQLQQIYHEDYEPYVDFLQECRILIKNLYEDEAIKREVLEELTDEKFLHAQELRTAFIQKLMTNALLKAQI
jgi:precorrin-2 dehydrogenase/sirohydrochlorin ferrochelatase